MSSNPLRPVIGFRPCLGLGFVPPSFGVEPIETQTASSSNPINFAEVLLSFAVGLYVCQDRLIKGFEELEKQALNKSCTKRVGECFGSQHRAHCGSVPAYSFLSRGPIHKAQDTVHSCFGLNRSYNHRGRVHVYYAGRFFRDPDFSIEITLRSTSPRWRRRPFRGRSCSPLDFRSHDSPSCQ